jgi:hypothetical protein
MMFKGLDIETITKEDVEFTMSQIRFFGRKLGSYSSLIRDLMLAGFCMLIMLGCGDEPSIEIKARAAELSSGFRKQAEAITTKQDESLKLLAQVNSRVGDLLLAADATKGQIETLKASLANPQAQQPGGDPAAPEPQEIERKSQTTPLLSDSPPAVRLYVSHSMPINREGQQLEAAIKAGELAGFEVSYSPRFDGQTQYPGIRFQSPSSTGWRVVYGFNATTLPFIRHVLTTTNTIVSQPRNTNPVVPQADLVSMHNQLHGGGQWTWPGDLATHLQTVHGVNLNGVSSNHGTSQFARQQSAVRPVSRGSSRNWRPSYQARSSCPSGGCPR